MKVRIAAAGLALLAVSAVGARAVEPSEMLKDPTLEARARVISQDIRCLVCRNENIDDSQADLAHDLRVLVRDRLKAGDTNEQVKQYLVARYGQYVLLEPPFDLGNALIWLAGPILLLIGGGVAVMWVRRPDPEAERRGRPLTEAERAELDGVLSGNAPAPRA